VTPQPNPKPSNEKEPNDMTVPKKSAPTSEELAAAYRLLADRINHQRCEASLRLLSWLSPGRQPVNR
jgi:hypothetical protein